MVLTVLMNNHRVTIQQTVSSCRAVCTCGWKGTRYAALRLAGWDRATAQGDAHTATEGK